MLGFFTIMHYGLYYLICSAVLKNWLEWKKALRVFLCAGSVVMFIGLLQVINPDLLLNQGSERVASTLGNPIYVGGYGLFLMFVAYLLYSKEDNKLWRITSVLLGLLALAGTFYSGTRGSLLGLAIGGGVGAVLYLFFLKEQIKARLGVRIPPGLPRRRA
jgi:4-amino-4-deoxy-L-arabinose transferase-like glycosyltransferase